jgi:hypothetical protein
VKWVLESFAADIAFWLDLSVLENEEFNSDRKAQIAQLYSVFCDLLSLLLQYFWNIVYSLNHIYL